MSVDRRISGSSGQVFVLSVWDVDVIAIVPVLLGQSKVDDIDQVALLAQTHEEVVRLDIAVNEVASVNELDSTDLVIAHKGKQRALISHIRD